MSVPSLRFVPLLLGLLIVFQAPARAEDTRPTLTVVNWSWFVEVDEDADESLPMAERSPVLREFSEEFGCQVVYLELDDEYSIRDFLLADPSGIDIVNLSTGFIDELSRQGVLLRLDPDLIPNLEDLRPGIRGLLPSSVEPFLCPYFAGQTGILYNSQVTGKPMTSWSDFWDLEAGYQVGTLGGSESVLGSFLMMAGDPISSNDQEALLRAGRLFKQQVDGGRVGYLGDDLETLAAKVASGELGAAYMYTGDALGFVDEYGDGVLTYSLPADGTEFSVDCWAVSASTTQTTLAHAFLDFMLRPEIQARQSLALYTQVVNTTARKILQARDSGHPYLEYLIGSEGLDPQEQLIHRSDSVAIEALWNRILESGTQ